MEEREKLLRLIDELLYLDKPSEELLTELNYRRKDPERALHNLRLLVPRIHRLLGVT